MAASDVKIGESWKAPLAAEFSSPYMAELKAFLLEQKQEGRRIFPRGPEYFRALDLTPLALAPHTFMAFYDDLNAGLFFPHGRGMQWEGHFLFATLRGKAARAMGQWCCSALFDYTPAVAIVGLVPLENKPARIMARAIGCRPVGRSVDVLGRACTRYVMERGHG